MASEKLFQRRLVIGYLITLALSAVIAAASIGLLHRVAASKDLVIYDYAQDLIYAQKLRQTGERQFVSFRGYMISRDPVLLQEFNSRRATFRSQLSDLRKISRHPDVLRLLDQIERADSDYNRGDAELLKKIRAGVKFQALETDFEKNIRPLRRLLEQNLNALIDLKQQDLERAKAESERSTYRSLELIVLVAGVALILAAGLAWILTRTLSRLYHSAVRATQLREEVLGIVAHDLRNPLSSIRLNSQVLERLSRSEASSRGKLATVAGAIERSADRMNRLIEDLLDFGKIESGHLRLELRTEDVSSLIQDALEALEPGAKAAGVRLTPELGESLGELVCDRDRIFQILSNLIGNAVKFTPAGGTIAVGASGDAERVRFWVKDTGPGIPASQLSHLFERYWQATETRKQGYGLGLSIAQGIALAHEGEIRVESELGQGTVFYVTLPRGLQPAREAQRPGAA